MIVGVWWLSRPAVPPLAQQPAADKPDSETTDKDTSKLRKDLPAAAATVRRPVTDLTSQFERSGTNRSKDDKSEPFSEVDLHGGETATLPSDTSPASTRAVAAAVDRQDQPQRYAAVSSLLANVDRFDPRRFESDASYRQDYLADALPARVFETAEPGDGVPVLQPVSANYQTIRQGEAVELAVVGEPGMPVSFTSTDLGQFADNGLTSITVQADDGGVATTTFTAGAGTINEVNILAGGPATAGQVKFVVNVAPAPGSRAEELAVAAASAPATPPASVVDPPSNPGAVQFDGQSGGANTQNQ